MPLKRMLDQRGSFDPEAVAVLLEAFDTVVAELGLRAPAEREMAAKLVIQLALAQPDLDAVKLRDNVLNLMLHETVTRLHWAAPLCVAAEILAHRFMAPSVAPRVAAARRGAQIGQQPESRPARCSTLA